MRAERWCDAMTRISPGDAVNIDPLIARFDPRWASPGRSIFPDVVDVGAPQTPMKNPDSVVIGVRLLAEPEDPSALAFKLIAFAMEHDADVVVLASIDYLGLEKYGFRTERICGTTDEERRICEEQILRFWNIDLVI